MDASVLESTTMAAKKTSKKPSKSDFIRRQPAEMSVADVIAAGKAAGVKFTSSLVYMVRGRQDGKATPKKASGKDASSKKPGAKKTPKKVSAPKKNAGPKQAATASKKATPRTSMVNKAGTVNKADFVRQHASLSPKDIVAKAKAEGVELSVTYVYNVRGGDKTVAKKKTAKKGTASKQPDASSTSPSKKVAPKPTASNGTRSSASASFVEDLLRAAAAELGLGRAMEILERERARVRAVLGAAS